MKKKEWDNATHQHAPQKAEGDVALTAAPSQPSKSGNQHHLICWNCGKPGHMSRKCSMPAKPPGDPNYLPFAPKTPKSLPGKSSTSPESGSASATVQEVAPPQEEDSEGVWAVYELPNFRGNPPLCVDKWESLADLDEDLEGEDLCVIMDEEA